jgi:hypothetical protein
MTKIPSLPYDQVIRALRRDEVIRLIEEAIELHIEALQESGEQIPPPSSIGEYVEVKAAWHTITVDG